jgi:uncharacterized protein YjdB
MKRFFRPLAIMLAIAISATTFVSCGEEEGEEGPTSIEVTSVTVTPSTLAIKVGEKQQLSASVEPQDATNKTVTWSSSAPAIAEVNASTGEVTAKAVGTATITATAGGKTATCAVTVATNVIAVTSVEISSTTLNLTEGDKQTLAATVKPDDATDKTVTWSSSAANIAEVNASTGEVTAKAAGSATITATAGGVSVTCAVTVAAKIIDATGVTVTPATLSIMVGEEQTLAAAVAPDDATDKTVTWSSNAANIAEVNATTGKVTAKAAGSATITATTANGKTASCNVTVKPIEANSVTVTPATLILEVGATQTLSASVEPDNAPDKTVTWSSSDANIAEVNASTGEVTAKAAGWATITAATTNGKTATSTVTVTGLVGSWLFDDPSDFTKAEVGQALVAHGTGFEAVDGGVRVSGEISTYYEVKFPGSSTEKITEYTMLIDSRFTTIGGNGGDWYAVYQSDLQNGNNEADVWIRGDGGVGVSNMYVVGLPVDFENYHRLVIAYKQPNMAFYVDGQHIGTTDFSPAGTDVLNRFALDPNGVLIFASGDNYVYQSIDVSKVSIWNKQLTDAEVTALGSVGN